MPDPEPTTKTCFVVGPIGEEGSDTRNRADMLLRYVIREALADEEFGYDVKRADEMPRPGLITVHVINAVLESDLVVADLTDLNPNAFYELAIRHMEQKPIIHMISSDQKIPFDVANFLALRFSLENPNTIDKAKKELQQQVRAIEGSGGRVPNPVSEAIGFRKLEQSGDSQAQLIASLADAIRQLEAQLRDMDRRLNLLSFQSSAEGILSELDKLSVRPTGQKTSGFGLPSLGSIKFGLSPSDLKGPTDVTPGSSAKTPREGK